MGGLLAIGERTIPDKGLFFGLYRGVVAANDDSKELHPHLCRVRIRVPQVYGDEIKDEELPWAWPAFPFGGGRLVDEKDKTKKYPYGLIAIPPVGASVWVAFEHGDPIRPIYLGAWYGEKDGKPEICEEAVTDYPDVLLLRDPTAANGMWLRFVREDRIELVCVRDDAHVTLHRSGAIDVKSRTGPITVESEDGKLSLKTGKLVSGPPIVDTRQSIEIDSSPSNNQVTIQAQTLRISASDIQLCSTGNIRLSAKEGTYNSSKKASGWDRHE